jgi:hypothetical protein
MRLLQLATLAIMPLPGILTANLAGCPLLPLTGPAHGIMVATCLI